MFRYYYDQETQTLLMAPPTPGHDMLVQAVNRAYARLTQQLPQLPMSLSQLFDIVLRGIDVTVSVRDSHNSKKHPDALPGVEYGDKLYMLGPVEIGNSQTLHGASEEKLNVLETVSQYCH